jgi:Xaa-Pro aminopeptidase
MTPREIQARLTALRGELERLGLTGFLVPRADEHQGEYVAPHAERLRWISGFTGSAGLAAILTDAAAVWVDGRYTLQVGDQVPADLFEHHHVTKSPAAEWLTKRLRTGDRLGYDPWLHTVEGVERLRTVCATAGAELVAVAANPVDAVWVDRPGPPLAPLVVHEAAHAGRDSADKRREVGRALEDARVDAAVLTAPDSIAWLLNVRGGDVRHTPLPLSFALIHKDATVDLFVDARKMSPAVAAHLGPDVRVGAPGDLGPALDRLGQARAKVQLEAASAAAWLADRLTTAGGEVVRGADPCALPRACKNPVELAGARAAHRRDGAALCRFLAWIARETPGGKVTEVAAADRLDAFRAEQPHFREPSFPTISGAGANGAIVHYRATPATDRPLAPGMLYLVDSGGQYPDGTTDVTRTVAIGSPTAEQRDRFTRVLRGHIDLAMARFPVGTSGPQLDTVARAPLWEAALDYDHGTGHGVGSYLGVHEGPQSVSKRASTVALKPGMIVSNEPGYYKTGEYGIRIESLVAVVEGGRPAGGEQDLLGFETLTLAPIDLALVEPAGLTGAQRAWLDAYHAWVRETITPLVDAETAAWLERATRPVG